MLRRDADARKLARFMAPMRVQGWRSKLPMNRRMLSLIFNDFRILGFKGAMREKKSGEISFWPTAEAG